MDAQKSETGEIFRKYAAGKGIKNPFFIYQKNSLKRSIVKNSCKKISYFFCFLNPDYFLTASTEEKFQK